MPIEIQALQELSEGFLDENPLATQAADRWREDEDRIPTPRTPIDDVCYAHPAVVMASRSHATCAINWLFGRFPGVQSTIVEAYGIVAAEDLRRLRACLIHRE